MKEWDKDWIHFSKRSRRGIFVLLGLFILIAVCPRLYYNYFASGSRYDIQITDLSEDKESPQSKNKEENTYYTQPKESFDPNQYTIDEWMAVGLSEKQAQSILNYLNTGAQFRIKSDVRKMYVIDSVLYKILLPKIDLPSSDASDKNYSSDKYEETVYNEQDTTYYQDENTSEKQLENHKITPMLINKASSKDLQKIVGIGPFFAKEIVKMRNDYGGITNVNQLLDIYNMNQDKLDSIRPYLIIDKNHVKKININLATEEELVKHPLIYREMAHSIVYFRKNYKNYKSLDELLLSPYIDSKVLKELKPYLKVE